MSFVKVSPMLIAKAERKGRTWDEAQKVTAWHSSPYEAMIIQKPKKKVRELAANSRTHFLLIC